MRKEKGLDALKEWCGKGLQQTDEHVEHGTTIKEWRCDLPYGQITATSNHSEMGVEMWDVSVDVETHDGKEFHWFEEENAEVRIDERDGEELLQVGHTGFRDDPVGITIGGGRIDDDRRYGRFAP